MPRMLKTPQQLKLPGMDGITKVKPPEEKFAPQPGRRTRAVHNVGFKQLGPLNGLQIASPKWGQHLKPLGVQKSLSDKPLLTQKQTKFRQRTAAHMGEATAALGLTALGARGAAGALRAVKRGDQVAKPLTKVPGIKGMKKKQLKRTANRLERASNTLGVASIGLGAAASLNSARLSYDASRRRAAPTNVKKSMTHTMDMGMSNDPHGSSQRYWDSIKENDDASAADHPDHSGDSGSLGVSPRDSRSEVEKALGMGALGRAQKITQAAEGLPKMQAKVFSGQRPAGPHANPIGPTPGSRAQAKGRMKPPARPQPRHAAPGMATGTKVGLTAGGAATAAGAGLGAYHYQQQRIGKSSRNMGAKAVAGGSLGGLAGAGAGLALTHGSEVGMRAGAALGTVGGIAAATGVKPRKPRPGKLQPLAKSVEVSKDWTKWNREHRKGHIGMGIEEHKQRGIDARKKMNRDQRIAALGGLGLYANYAHNRIATAPPNPRTGRIGPYPTMGQQAGAWGHFANSAKKDSKYSMRGRGVKDAVRMTGGMLKHSPHTPAAVVLGGITAAGYAGAIHHHRQSEAHKKAISQQRYANAKKKAQVHKAFTKPSRRTQQNALNIGGGAALGATLTRTTSRQGGNILLNTAKLKTRSGKLGLATGLAGAGSLVAANRMNSYKGKSTLKKITRPEPYTPLYRPQR